MHAFTAYPLWPRLERLQRLVKNCTGHRINRARHNFSNIEFPELPLGSFQCRAAARTVRAFLAFLSYPRSLYRRYVGHAGAWPPPRLNREKREISYLRSLRGTRAVTHARASTGGSHDSGHDCGSLCARSSHDPGREAIAARCAFGSVFPSRGSNVLLPELRGYFNTFFIALSFRNSSFLLGKEKQGGQ